LGGCAIGA